MDQSPYALPQTDNEPPLPQHAGANAARITVYSLLAAMLLAGVWVRFNDRIGAIAPALTGPAAMVADEAGLSGRIKGLVEIALVAPDATTQAIAALQLSGADMAALTRAVEQQQLRLVRLPLFDAGPELPDAPGRTVVVSSGGYTRMVRLGRAPIVLTLPIARVGTVSFHGLDAAPVTIGAVTLNGPMTLPSLTGGQVLNVGVVAQ